MMAGVVRHAPTGAEPARRRWVILGLCWLVFATTFVDRLAWSQLATHATADLRLPLAELGFAVTAFYVGYACSNILSGPLIDRLGSRRSMVVSLGLLSLSVWMFGAFSRPGLIIPLQLLMGLAAGVDYAACVKMLAGWFERVEQGRAFGVLISATSASVLLTNLCAGAVSGRLGWRLIYECLGALTFGVMLLTLWLARDPAPLKMQAGPPAPTLALLSNPRFVRLAVAGFGAGWGTWGFAFWAPALMTRGHHLSGPQAAMVMTLFGLGALVGAPVSGWIGDRSGGRQREVLTLAVIALDIGLLAFGAMSAVWQFALIAPLLGVAAFGYGPLLGPMLAELGGPERAASTTGFASGFWQFGSIISPSLVGLAYEASHRFYATFVVLAIGPLLAGVALWAIPNASGEPGEKVHV